MDRILGGGRWLCPRCGYVREGYQRAKQPHLAKIGACSVCEAGRYANHPSWPYVSVRVKSLRDDPDADEARAILHEELRLIEAERWISKAAERVLELRRQMDTDPLEEWPDA